MLAIGDRTLSSERFCQPTSLMARVTNSTGQAKRAWCIAGLVNHGELRMKRTTGRISVRFCR